MIDKKGTLIICLLVLIYNLTNYFMNNDYFYEEGFELKDAMGFYRSGDFKKALEILKPLAEQGSDAAQYNLGLMYQKGQGIPQDYALAHMWFNLCGSSGDKDCEKNRNIIEERMSREQISQAQEFARNWKPTMFIDNSAVSKKAEQKLENAVPNIVDAGALKSYIGQIQRIIEGAKRYPETLRKAGRQGKLKVQFTILKNGEVDNVRLLTETPYPKFNREAIAAIKRAAPFPKIPDIIKKRELKIILPWRFELN